MTEGQPSRPEVLTQDSLPFLETHPDTLAVVATLFGMRPPEVTSCRVLELNCGSGGNLIPMALGLPGARFVGIDASSDQVEAGRATIVALGLSNIELHVTSIADLGPEIGTFDYILCHGVYSWVAEPLRGKILEICATRLVEQGVAYVSYNTYPGWHLRGMIREMLGFHVRKFDDPAERVDQARAFLEFLVRSAWNPGSTYARLLEEQAARLRPEADARIDREYLDDVNQPVYYRDFVDRAAVLGLACLGDARFGSILEFVPPDLKAKLERFSADPVDQEQYLDFLRNRSFRRTLLCRARVERSPNPRPDALGSLQVTALVAPAGPPDVRSMTPEEFRTPTGSTLTVADPLLKAALLVLAERWPRPTPFDDLWAEAHARIDPGPSVAGLVEDPTTLAAPLLQGYAAGWVELHVHVPEFLASPGERPRASPLARLQVEANGRVTNLRHQLVELTRFDRHLIRLLDGTRDRDALIDALLALVHEGALSIRSDGPTDRTPERDRQIIGESLTHSLGRLAVAALLVG